MEAKDLIGVLGDIRRMAMTGMECHDKQFDLKRIKNLCEVTMLRYNNWLPDSPENPPDSP